MKHDETVNQEPAVAPISERDLAPIPARDKARAAAQDLDVIKEAAPSEKFDVNRKRDANGKPIRSFISIGEKIHNEITYRGVDWLMNSTFGVAFAYATSRTEWGRRIWNKPLNKFFTAVLEPVVKAFNGSKTALESSVGYGVMFLSIMFGGTVTIPPLMYLENPKNKVPFIKKLDTWIYGKDKVEHDPKFAHAYQEIKEQPKKDFGTGMKTRFIALAPLLAFTVHEPSHLFVKKHFYDYIAKGTKYIGNKIGIGKGEYWLKRSVEKLPFNLSPSEFEKIDSLSKNEFLAKAELSPKNRKKMEALSEDELKKVLKSTKEDSKNGNFLHDTIAFDFGLTIMYSFLHEIAYKLFAQKKDDARKAKEELAHHHTPNETVAIKEEPVKSPEHDSPAHSNAPHAKVSNVAARETLKPAEQREMAQA